MNYSKSKQISKNKAEAFKQKNHGLTRAELKIAKLPIKELINHKMQIHKKQSKLSKHMRDIVDLRFAFLVKEGVIKSPDFND